MLRLYQQQFQISERLQRSLYTLIIWEWLLFPLQLYSASRMMKVRKCIITSVTVLVIASDLLDIALPPQIILHLITFIPFSSLFVFLSPTDKGPVLWRIWWHTFLTVDSWKFEWLLGPKADAGKYRCLQVWSGSRCTLDNCRYGVYTLVLEMKIEPFSLSNMGELEMWGGGLQEAICNGKWQMSSDI